MDKIQSFDQLRVLRVYYKSKKIIHCHGVFDVLHAGHLAYFESAKSLGDILVVTITADKFVNKGPGRPYFAESIRAKMLAGLECVDYVVISHSKTAVDAILELGPDYYVKGPDYRDYSKDITKEIYNEESAVKLCGGSMAFTDDDTFSSGTLINRFLVNWSDDQVKTISKIKDLGGFSKIQEILEGISKLRVSVIGEPIVDTYRFVEPQNISSKSPSISAKFLYEENYCGGSLAIANHLADFVEHVNLLFTSNSEAYFSKMLPKKMDERIEMHSHFVSSPTPRKTRYISIDKSQRIFEVTDLRDDQWVNQDPRMFIEQMELITGASDVAILCDFGHGLFEGKVLEACQNIAQFIGLNVQTNSSNYGFNAYHKHCKWDYLSLDTREARIAYHDRISSPLELGREIETYVGSSHSMTLGSNGSNYYCNKDVYFSPAFSDQVVDATGAGDAFFALTSLLVKIGAPPEFVPFLGNVFAGLKTKIIGNKSSVTKSQLLKACEAILK